MRDQEFAAWLGTSAKVMVSGPGAEDGFVTMKSLVTAIVLLTASVYVGVITWGMHVRKSGMQHAGAARVSVSNMDAGSDRVRRGQEIFNHTPQYAPEFAGNSLSCESCHAEAGTQPFAAPVTGVVARYPQYMARAGRMVPLEDRIRECFVRSENGKPPADGSEVMVDLLAYMKWLSPERKGGSKLVGAGLVKLQPLTPDPVRGGEMYAAQCAGCHGERGQGTGVWPPLWGELSFNDGAGMSTLPKFAAFIYHNMPQNRMGILTPQDSYDIAAYVLKQPRPAMNPAYARY